MKDLKISIIIPVYNAEKYLKQCLDSVANQTLDDIEIICVDDGSTDSSSNILDEYSKKDKRFKVISQNNSGPGESRNTGLEHAKGNFIFFLDADDWLDLNTLERLYSNAISNNSEIVFFKVMIYDESKKESRYNKVFDFYKYFDEETDFNNLTFDYTDVKSFVLNSSFAPWLKLYKKDLISNFPFPKGFLGEDILVHAQTLLTADKMSFCPEECYFYRVSVADSNMDNAKKNETVFNIFHAIGDVEKFLIENNLIEKLSDEFTAFVMRQLTFWFTNCSSEHSQEFFKKAKEKLLELDLSDEKVDKFSNHISNPYKNIINSNSSNEAEILNKIDETKLKNEKEIVKYQNRIKNQKIRYEKKLNNHKRIINEMQNSNSWKTTKPIRKLFKILK